MAYQSPQLHYLQPADPDLASAIPFGILLNKPVGKLLICTDCETVVSSEGQRYSAAVL